MWLSPVTRASWELKSAPINGWPCLRERTTAGDIFGRSLGRVCVVDGFLHNRLQVVGGNVVEFFFQRLHDRGNDFSGLLNPTRSRGSTLERFEDLFLPGQDVGDPGPHDVF